MGGVYLKWIALFVQLLLVSADPVPSCQISDSECMKTAAQSVLHTLVAGIPEIGAETLDILHLNKVKVELAGLKLSIKDAEIKGLDNSIIDKVFVNEKKKELKLVYHTDAQLTGKYKASGQLLILPISGDGNMDFRLKHLEVHVHMPFELIKNEEGQDVLDLQSFSLKYDVKEGAHFTLTNLFNGNKELSDGMHTFMNENWKIITQEFGMPILEAGHKVIFDSIKKYVALHPLQS